MRSPFISRRRFAQATALAVITARRGLGWQSQDQTVEIHPNVPVGVIRPELHGHFAEHLGSCTYGGLWVGRGSPIPNINGHRKQAVDWLKAVGIPVLRWPGGCFADDYHWRDGIGPADKRPKRVNIHWGNYTEDNSFGTHEFVELCRLIGAEPYIAGNLGSGTPQELRDWVEYCNYPAGSTLSDERARNGSTDPLKVRYWGVGNENWGCGGNMHGDEYAAHYRQFATYVRNFGGVRPFRIACGPNGNDTVWTRSFFDDMRGRGLPEGFAMHFYSNGKSTPMKFTVEHLQEQLSSFSVLEAGIKQQRALLDSYDPQRRVGLLVDEWGVWDRMIPEEEKKYGALFQQITMRSAVAAAMGLNVFHRHADKLVMCNIAQTVNVLHSLLLTDGPRCIRTTTYYAFDMLKDHRGKTAVVTDQQAKGPLDLSVSASRDAQSMVITLVNPRHDQSSRVSLRFTGAQVSAPTATLLHHKDYNAANTFDQPDVIAPKPHEAQLAAGAVRVEVPPMSVVTLRCKV